MIAFTMGGLQDAVRLILHLILDGKEPNLGVVITLFLFMGTIAAEHLRQGGPITDMYLLASTLVETTLTSEGDWLFDKEGCLSIWL